MFGMLQVDQHGGGEDAGLQVVADADHRPLEVGHVELAQRLDVGGVGDRGVGEVVGEALHDSLIAVHAEDLGAAADQFQRQRRTEPAQAEHDHPARPTAVIVS